MNNKLLYFFVFSISLLLLSAGIFEIGNNGKSNTLSDIFNESNQKPIILIHDVSPVYFNELKDIEEIINKNHYQNRTYLFIIVNHANEHNLKNYPEFEEYLHHLEDEGYHIEYHAYNHEGKEFDCNKSTAEEKVNKSFEILSDCGFNTTNIKYFIPPRYGLSKDAKEVFMNKNISIFVGNQLFKKENGNVKCITITNKEYTWYLPKNMTKEAEVLALSDYKTSQHQFYLSIHPKAVNYGGGLEFLDYFLNKTG